jgi:alpha-beta hydrolase superfamily lysophospholipase
LEYVLRNPEGLRGVVVSAAVLSQPSISPVLFLIARILSRIWARFSMETGMDITILSRDPVMREIRRNDPLAHRTGTARLGTELEAAAAWAQEHAHELRLPLLMMHGGADQLVPIEAGRVFFQNVTFPDKLRVEYPGAYHELHNDTDRLKVFGDLARWLEEHL